MLEGFRVWCFAGAKHSCQNSLAGRTPVLVASFCFAIMFSVCMHVCIYEWEL